jgi:MFS family permease
VLSKHLFLNEQGGIRRDIDSPIFVLAAVLLGIFVITSFNFLPLLLPAAQHAYGLTDTQLERLKNWELFSTGIASVCFTLFMLRRVNWRHVGIAACLLLVACNLASVYVGSFEQILALRTLAGLGQGLGFSLALVGLNVSKRPGRSFSMWVCVSSLWIGCLFLLLPNWMSGEPRGGLDVLFLFYAATALLATPIFLWYPNNGRRDRDAVNLEAAGGHKHSFRDFAVPTVLVALAILTGYMMVGITYPDIVLYGTRLGFDERHVTEAVMLGTFLTVFVAWLAAVTDARRNDLVSLISVGLVSTLAVWIYADAHTESSYLAALVTFLALTTVFTGGLLFKAMAVVDRSGFLASLGPELSSSGIFLGPMLATALRGPSDLRGQMMIAAALIPISLTLAVIGQTMKVGVHNVKSVTK